MTKERRKSTMTYNQRRDLAVSLFREGLTTKKVQEKVEQESGTAMAPQDYRLFKELARFEEEGYEKVFDELDKHEDAWTLPEAFIHASRRMAYNKAYQTFIHQITPHLFKSEGRRYIWQSDLKKGDWLSHKKGKAKEKVTKKELKKEQEKQSMLSLVLDSLNQIKERVSALEKQVKALAK